MNLTTATELLRNAYAKVEKAFTGVHAQQYTPGPLVVNDELAVNHVPPKMLVPTMVIDKLSKYTITPQDVQVLAQLITHDTKVHEIGRLLGISALCMHALGATVTSIDANGCTEWTWPLRITYDQRMLVHGDNVSVDTVTIPNNLVNTVSHRVLDGKCTLLDTTFTPSMCTNADIVFEDVWCDATEDVLIATLLDAVAAQQVKWLVVHDVREFIHVATTLPRLLAQRPCLHAVYAGECAVVYRDHVPVVNVESKNTTRWCPSRGDYHG